MFAPLRSKLASFVIKSCIVYSICLGLLPFKYNPATAKLKRSKCALVYSVCLNIAFIGILVLLFTEQQMLRSEFISKKPLNTIINVAQISIGMFTFVVTLYKKWSCSTRMMAAFDGLIRLERDHFDKYGGGATDSCATFDCYVTAKGCMNLLQVVSLTYAMYGINPKPDAHFVLSMGLVGILQNILFLTQNHFYYGVLYVYRNFWLLNRRLQALTTDHCHVDGSLSKGQCRQLADQVGAMAGIYLRLLRVSGELSAVFEYTNLLMTANILSANVQNLFYVLVLLGGKFMKAEIWAVFSIFQVIVVNMVDFWLLIAVCEKTANRAAQTSVILRRFNEFPDLDVRLTREIEAFAQLCCNEKLRFSLCGMLDFNHRMGHNVITGTIAHLIFLVQFDYLNL